MAMNFSSFPSLPQVASPQGEEACLEGEAEGDVTYGKCLAKDKTLLCQGDIRANGLL